MNLTQRSRHHECELIISHEIAILIKKFALIDASNDEDVTLGFAALNATALRCLIEIQTLRRVFAACFVTRIHLNGTDFALVAPFIDEVMRSMSLKGLYARLPKALKGLRVRFPQRILTPCVCG